METEQHERIVSRILDPLLASHQSAYHLPRTLHTYVTLRPHNFLMRCLDYMQTCEAALSEPNPSGSWVRGILWQEHLFLGI